MIITLHNLAAAGLSEVGGKAWNLGRLADTGERVPSCFAIPVSESRSFAEFARLAEIYSLKLDAESFASKVRRRYKEVFHTYKRLYELLEFGFLAVPALRQSQLSIRSSASIEDLDGMSGAGQHDTFLGVFGIEAVAEAVAMCWASQWTERAITYRKSHSVVSDEACMGVIVQELISADKAGVVFTQDPTDNKGCVLIEAIRGFGDALVSGSVIPERIRIDRFSGAIIEKVPAPGTAGCLSEAEIEVLLQAVLRIESSFGGPQDIEWVFAGPRLYIVQTRPMTYRIAV